MILLQAKEKVFFVNSASSETADKSNRLVANLKT